MCNRQEIILEKRGNLNVYLIIVTTIFKIEWGKKFERVYELQGGREAGILGRKSNLEIWQFIYLLL